MTEPSRIRGCIAATIARGLVLALRAFVSTWRVRGTAQVLGTVERLAREPLLIGFWHGSYLPLFGLLRGIPASVFVGAGFRGLVIESICRAEGFHPVRLPTRDREHAIERMRRALDGPRPCASALDGALGPARRVKPALVQIASECSARILPLAVVARPRWILPWRWDQRELPLPFARIELRVGEPIAIPARLSEGEVDGWRDRIRSEIEALVAADAPGAASAPPD